MRYTTGPNRLQWNQHRKSFASLLGGNDRRVVGPSYDPAVSDWLTRAVANGGTISDTTLHAADILVTSAKAKNYWNCLNRVNLFAGNQLAACLVPLLVGGGFAIDDNHDFVNGDYTEATGLKGDGLTKHLRTGFIPSVSMVLYDTHVSVYNRTAGVGAGVNKASMGTGTDDSTSEITLLLPGYNNDNLVAYMTSYTNNMASSGYTDPPGHIIISRTANNSLVAYQAGVAYDSDVLVDGAPALPTGQMYIFAKNQYQSSAIGFLCPQYLAGYTLGSKMTAQNALDFSTDFQAFQTALGRQV
jgi:hypothetical protein